MSEKQEADAVSAEQVESYLKSHPDFFQTREHLLDGLKIPHQSGSAISLGERQVQMFREHRDQLQAKLQELIETAQENDKHFETSKRLLLNLLEARTLDEIQIVVQEAFKDSDNIQFSNVVLFGQQTDFPISDIRLVGLDEARQSLGVLLESTQAVCGQFSAKQLSCLFGTESDEVSSAAVIPLRNGEILGMFCLGSKNQNHFDSSMGSLFLSYISEFIGRILPDLLQRARSSKLTDQVPTLLD